MTATARASNFLWGGEPAIFEDDIAIRLIPEAMADHVRAGPLVGPSAGAGLMVYRPGIRDCSFL
jgi:hypothetical protein